MSEVAHLASVRVHNGLCTRSFRVFSRPRDITSETSNYRHVKLAKTRCEHVENHATRSSIGVMTLTTNIRFDPDKIAYYLRTRDPGKIIASWGIALLSAIGDADAIVLRVTYAEPRERYLGYDTEIAPESPEPPAIEIPTLDIHNVLFTNGSTRPHIGAIISVRRVVNPVAVLRPGATLTTKKISSWRTGRPEGHKCAREIGIMSAEGLLPLHNRTTAATPSWCNDHQARNAGVGLARSPIKAPSPISPSRWAPQCRSRQINA